jgi:hypoxanthine phosphoribosyltransferase
MAEDAYLGKNILIVDDINDSGATLNWIKQDWEDFHPSQKEPWDKIWNNNVRFAVLINNQASNFKRIDYSGLEINKLDDPRWCNFPYEEWWKK